LKIPLKRGKIYIENGGPLTWKAQDFIFKGKAQCFPSEGWEKRWGELRFENLLKVEYN